MNEAEDVRGGVMLLMAIGLVVVFTFALNVMACSVAFYVNCDIIPLMKSHKSFILIGAFINIFITTISTIILINRTLNKDGKY
jgi:hypothetical protein